MFDITEPPTRVATVGCAVLILYVMLSFGIQTTMTVARDFRGAIPSLYRQPTLHGIGSLRGSALAATVYDMPNVLSLRTVSALQRNQRRGYTWL